MSIEQSKDPLQNITEIIRDLFDEYEGPVTPSLNAKSVAQWDSLANVQLMVMVEQRFGVRFTVAEIGELKNVGELMALIQRKQH
jgi:acyl carrier protein